VASQFLNSDIVHWSIAMLEVTEIVPPIRREWKIFFGVVALVIVGLIVNWLATAVQRVRDAAARMTDV